MKTILPPISLYIHIPWCIRKCPYCDFNSHQAKNIPEELYIKQLIYDFIQEKPYLYGRNLHSIFIGGGTPSLFNPYNLGKLLSELNKMVSFPNNIEITMEANPSTFEQQKFIEFHSIGINRLSLGIQSFQPQHLQTLGRVHGQREALQAASQAHDAGFDNFNLDLMYGITNQTVEQVVNDLSTAIAMQPSHLSWYQLTIEPNTIFYSHPPTLPNDEIIWKMQQAGTEILTQAGFNQYEVSAWSLPNRQSQHNLNYWKFGDYIGIGAGAHGKITNHNWQITRKIKKKIPTHYLKAKNPLAEKKVLTKEEIPFEFFLNSLRLVKGVSLNTFTAKTGMPLSVIEPILQQLQQKKLMLANRLQTTNQGYRFLNDVLTFFL